MSALREKFLKTYANVPLQLRDEIILVHESEPISWKVAYLEVKEKTELGDSILRKLEKLDLI